MKIFLSHKSRDKFTVTTFSNALQEPLTGWIDETGLFWGEDIQTELKSVISSEVDYFIIFLDRDADKSRWVKSELRWAYEKQQALKRTFILPVLLPDTAVDDFSKEFLELFLGDSKKNIYHLKLHDHSTNSLIDLSKRASLEIFKLLAKEYKGIIESKIRKDIVLLMPTFHVNPFLSTFLDSFSERVIENSDHVYNLVLKKTRVTSNYDPNLSSFLENFKGNQLGDSILIAFPSSPAAYKEILTPEKIESFKDLKVILLDVDPYEGLEREKLDERRAALKKATYIKSIILSNTRKACEIAARKIIDFVEGDFNHIKVIICDGHYHNRGELFKTFLSDFSKVAQRCDDSDKEGIHVEFFPNEYSKMVEKKIFFGDALNQSYQYTRKVLLAHQEKISECPTFIFCANDVIALGARQALNSFSRDTLKYTNIVSYDGSKLLRLLCSELEDDYARIFLSQNYSDYTKVLKNEIDRVAYGVAAGYEYVDEKILYIDPMIDDNLSFLPRIYD